MTMVRTRSCTSGRHSRPPRHLIAVQGGESPRFLERVRCPVAATHGTASRSVSSSHAWPSGAPLRLGKRVSCDHVQQPPRGHRRARPRCLNPHECDGMAYRHYFASARIASRSRGPAAPTLVPLRECPGETACRARRRTPPVGLVSMPAPTLPLRSARRPARDRTSIPSRA